MRPINQIARERLDSALQRAAPASAARLAVALGVSKPTVLRMLRERTGDICHLGSGKHARYALQRPLRGNRGQIPVFSIDAQGVGHEFGGLRLVAPAGSILDLAARCWPAPDTGPAGWWDGLPYPLYDMQPQGFLGRAFARLRHAALGVAADPRQWNDDDILWVLSQSGDDTTGNLIVGEAAYRKWQAAGNEAAPPLPPEQRAGIYAQLAGQAVTLGIAGSSAGGEFPKFTALRQQPGAETPHVIVKFSGADASPAVRRWADLLVCEHIALDTLAAVAGITASRSRIIEHDGRTFLESERFDRVGLSGRKSLVSLANLNSALLGTPRADWPHVAERMIRRGWLSAEDCARIRVLWWYGRLIANSDMHAGNLSFHPGSGHAGPALVLAPAYDMLPMRYAPLAGGEVPPPVCPQPPLPLPSERESWHLAATAALRFWALAADDPRISPSFRTLCEEHHRTLRAAAMRSKSTPI